MQTVGPVTLTLNALTTQRDPSQNVGSQSVAVQVQNASVFVLQVVSDGNLYNLQAFTAQTIPCSSQSITILPTATPGGGTAATTCWLVWLLKGEAPPQQDGQLTAQAIAASITSALQLATARELLSASVVVDTTVRFVNFTASKAYQSFAAFISSDPTPNLIKGSIQNITTSLASPFQDLSSSHPDYFAVPCAAGDSMTIAYQGDAAQANNTFFVVGLNVAIPSGLTRPDGFPMPLGRSAAEVSGAINKTLVAAPGANRRILVAVLSIEADVAVASGAVTAQVTVNGSTVNILRVASNTTIGNSEIITPPLGILCDANTAVLATTSGINYDATCLYDVV